MSKKPVISAVVILLIIVVWVASGAIFGGGNSDGQSADDANGQDADRLFLVRAEEISAEDYIRNVVVRGRTEALRTVELAAEVEGRVLDTPVQEGQRVSEGDLICQLAPYDREAALAEARARADQERLEYRVAQELFENGHRSETQVAAAKAELDAALAQVSRAEVALDNTSITAPFSGLLDERPAEVGNFLQKGATCGVLMTIDPFLVVGEVSDQDVEQIEVGSPAVVEFQDGREIDATIRYVASRARPETRTFRVEVEIPNENGDMREGLTADIRIPVSSIQAHFLSSSVLVLRDDGEVGVHAVEDGTVRFYPITIVGDAVAGVWVTGLPADLTLITGGHNFVTAGQAVRVNMEGGSGETS